MALDPSVRAPRGPMPAQDPTAPPWSLANLGAAPTATMAPPSTYAPPGDLTGKVFSGHAPGATPYGDFVAPNPAAIAGDPAYQFRAAEGQKAIEHSAAARGTLLGGGQLKALERYRQGLASEEAGKAFDRALANYNANRDTNAQNFNESNTQFRGDLDVFGANNQVGQNWARLDPTAGGDGSMAHSMSMGTLPPGVSTVVGTTPTLDPEYEARINAQRQQNALSDLARARTAGPAPHAQWWNPQLVAAPGVRPSAR